MNSDDRSKLIDEVLALRASNQALQKRVEELEAGILKYVNHWNLYFGSPKVGQPPAIQDVKQLLTK